MKLWLQNNHDNLLILSYNVCCGEMSSLTHKFSKKRVEISVPDINEGIGSGKK